MDLQMPVMDGLTTARRISTRYSRRKRPQMIALEAGMDAYLSKPVRGDQLARALEEAFLRAEKTRNHHPA